MAKNRKKYIKQGLLDMLYFIAGAIIYGIAMDVFIVPHHMAPGGISGIASILQTKVGWDAGIMYFVLNLPLFVIAFFSFGFKFVSKTFVAMTTVSVFTELISVLFPDFKYAAGTTDVAEGLIAALFGGLLSGLGLAIIFLRGATTGGSEIGAKLIKKKFPALPFGTTILMIDLCVVTTGFIVFKEVNAALFSLIVVFLTSSVIDFILDGSSVARVVYIMSAKNEEIKSVLMQKMGRGVTIIRAAGGYTNASMNMVMCAISRNQVPEIKNIVKEYDPSAFVIILHATEIIGLGFADVNKEQL